MRGLVSRILIWFSLLAGASLCEDRKAYQGEL